MFWFLNLNLKITRNNSTYASISFVVTMEKRASRNSVTRAVTRTESAARRVCASASSCGRESSVTSQQPTNALTTVLGEGHVTSYHGSANARMVTQALTVPSLPGTLTFSLAIFSVLFLKIFPAPPTHTIVPLVHLSTLLYNYVS